MRRESRRFTGAVFFQAASHGSVIQGVEIRDKMGKGLCWLGRLIHIHSDSESHLVSVGGRKLVGSGGGGCGSSAQVAQSLGQIDELHSKDVLGCGMVYACLVLWGRREGGMSLHFQLYD